MDKATKVIKRYIILWRNLYLSINLTWNSSRFYFILRIVLEIAVTLIPIILAYMMRNIINILSEQVDNKVNIFIKSVIIYFLLQLFSIFFNKLKETCAQCHQDIINNSIDLKILDKIGSLDISFFDNPKFYDEMINAARDSQALQLLTWISLNLIRSILQVSSCVLILGKLGWYIPVILLTLNIPSIIIDYKYVKKNYSWQRNRTKKERKMNYLKSILSTKAFAKEVRIYSIQKYIIQKFTKLWREWYNEKKEILYLKTLWSSISTILPNIAAAFILVNVGINIINKTLRIGDFSLYSSMISQFMAGVSGVFSALTQVYENELKLTNFRIFLNWKPIIECNGDTKLTTPINIRFENVSFKYPETGRYVLKNINFVIDEYEKVALVGLNGSGKSTIIKLILRLYEPTEGNIYINNINIKEYDIDDLRKSFGIVFQDFSCYSLKLKENITISDVNNDNNIEQLEHACKAAGLFTLINKFSKGFDTYLTRRFDDNGEELSGGEWQKIALARAYFQESKFMIMDEPTSSLDPESEYLVFETLKNICEKKGAVFISHRLSSIVMADKIIVLENGRIIETGKHIDLIKKNGRYAHLFNIQAERYKMKNAN